MSFRSADGLPGGLAYMIENGHPADGSHAENAEPTQQLVNPPHVNSTTNPRVAAWVRHRAKEDAQMQAAEKAGS